METFTQPCWMDHTTGIHILQRGAKPSSQRQGERRLRRRTVLFQQLQWTFEDVFCCALICKTFPLQPDPHSRIGRRFFHQVSPKDDVRYKLPTEKSNSLIQHVWWEATNRLESFLSRRWVRRALKKGTCPFSMMERCSMVVSFSHIRLGACLEALQDVFQQISNFQED